MADLNGKTVAIVVDNYFEEVEMTNPRKALEEAGATVHLVATKDQAVFGMNHAEMGDEFDADASIDEVNSKEYDALVIPGGTINGDQLRVHETAQHWVKEFLEQQTKPVAIICHGPWILVDSGLARDRKLTSYPTLRQDLINAGADWVDEEVVVDGNLITSRNPDDLPSFNEALINMLGDQEAKDENN